MNNLWFSLTQTHLTPEMKGVFIFLFTLAVVCLGLAAWKSQQQPKKSVTTSRTVSKPSKPTKSAKKKRSKK